MKKLSRIILSLISIGIGFTACQKSTCPCCSGNDILYQYSVLAGINNSIYDGDLTIRELKEKGDIGLGTYTTFNGEMVMVDGVCYQVLESGIVEASDETTTPYAVTTFFDHDVSLEINEAVDYPKLRELIENQLPSKNYFYAFKIKGHFEMIHCGGAPKQTRPYTNTLADIIAVRPQYQKENVTGTIAGFWCPAYVGEVTLAGFHLHFIADDLSIGGHLLDFKSSQLQVSYDVIKNMTFDLQDNEEFANKMFKADQGY